MVVVCGREASRKIRRLLSCPSLYALFCPFNMSVSCLFAPVVAPPVDSCRFRPTDSQARTPVRRGGASKKRRARRTTCDDQFD